MHNSLPRKILINAFEWFTIVHVLWRHLIILVLSNSTFLGGGIVVLHI